MRMLHRALLRGLQTAGRRNPPLPASVPPARQMSFGIPASGVNLAFVVLGGGSLTAALIYAYKTVHSDSMRYNNRIANIEARYKNDPDPVTEVSTLHAVAETVARETVIEKASEGPEPVEEELPVAEVAVAIPAELAPNTGEAYESVVSMVMMEAETKETAAAAEEAAESALPVAAETTSMEPTVTVAEAVVEPSAVKDAPAA